MFKSDQPGGQPSLSFPNPSRSFDEARGGVNFWGYDRTFEVTFFIHALALTKMSPQIGDSEAECLNAFDRNRDQICAAATGIYGRRWNIKDPRSYVLTEAEF